MSDFANKSLQRNIMTLCDEMSDKELLELSNYLAYGFLDEESMTEATETFVDKAFGLPDWFRFVKTEHERRNKKTYFVERPWFDLDQYRAIVMFYMTKRFALAVAKVDKLEAEAKLVKVSKKLLKTKIKEAVLLSEYGGVFDKVEGWCNVADVLIDEGLLVLPED